MRRKTFESYCTIFPGERDGLGLLERQLADDEDLQNRATLPGHITASAIVLSPDRTRIAVVHHNTLDKWLAPGGHWDKGDSNPLAAARREADEEIGVELEMYIPLAAQDHEVPLDIDSHDIPANPAKQEPAHVHHDFRYTFVAGSEDLKNDDDGVDGAEWAELDDPRLHMPRVVSKLRQLKLVHTSVVHNFDD
ncbi:MAG TPA: NUDIX domain-containing protein [Candidatus Saccharimonadales bacterium]|jgi:8-oxo-dGTP pyrophosphatase MutT (NUDIX family)